MLDEATSNLDSATEREVMDSVLERRQGRTTLLFGHRLSALRAADRIYVLAGGRIVADSVSVLGTSIWCR